MLNQGDTRSTAVDDWPPTFSASLTSLLGVVVAIVILGVTANALQARLLGADPPLILDVASQLPFYAGLAGIALVALHADGVSLRDIGAARRQVLPAVVATGGFVVALNAVVAAFIGLTGQDLSVGLYVVYARLFDHTPAMMAITAAFSYLVIGPVEELIFRGYLQNKLVTLAGGQRSTSRVALGIVLAGVVFALIHLPDLLLQEGAGLGETAGMMVLLTLSALTFGTIYELTSNLYLVALLHGIGDYWLLVVDPGTWPNWGIIIGLYALLIVAYRYWPALTSGQSVGPLN